jgi:hypothetical protein
MRLNACKRYCLQFLLCTFLNRAQYLFLLLLTFLLGRKNLAILLQILITTFFSLCCLFFAKCYQRVFLTSAFSKCLILKNRQTVLIKIDDD